MLRTPLYLKTFIDSNNKLSNTQSQSLSAAHEGFTTKMTIRPFFYLIKKNSCISLQSGSYRTKAIKAEICDSKDSCLIAFFV